MHLVPAGGEARGEASWTTRSKGGGVGGEIGHRRARARHRAPRRRGAHPLRAVAGSQQRVDRVAHRAVPVRSEACAVGVFPPVVRERGVFRGVRVRPGEGRVRRSGKVHGPQGAADHVGPRGSRLGAAVVVGDPVSNDSDSPVSKGSYSSVSKGSSWSRRFGSSRSDSSRTDDDWRVGSRTKRRSGRNRSRRRRGIWKRSAGSSRRSGSGCRRRFRVRPDVLHATR